MDRFDQFIRKLDFRLLIKIYLIVSFVIIVLCGSVIAYSMRDKIYMAMDYEKASEVFKKYGTGDMLKQQLNKLTADSKDIINGVILDKNNNVLFKVNNNILGHNIEISLVPYKEDSKYLKDDINKNIIYKITSEEEIILNKDYISNNKKEIKSIDDEFSYERDLSNNNIYLLNYMVDKNAMTKVFIFRKATPIPYAEKALEVLGTIAGIIFAIYWIGLALWVYKDAGKKQSNAALWGLLVLVTNLAGLIIYNIYKQNSIICHKCGFMQGKENIFCVNCGTRINNSCSKCGSIIKGKEYYCSKCGNKL